MEKERPSDAPNLYEDSFPLTIQQFGAWMKKLRNEKGLTLNALSELTGYSNPYLSQVETGKKKSYPSPALLAKLAPNLGVEYYQLLAAAGYEDLAQGIRYKDMVEEFSDLDEKEKELKRLRHEIKAWDHVTDVKTFLEDDFIFYDAEDEEAATVIKPEYNGHTLTADDRERMLKMMEILFPQYQKPWNPKGKR